MRTQSSVLNPIVTIHNSQAITTSQSVASYFMKRHDDVLKRLRSLDCSPEFTARNFAVCYKNNELQNGKSLPYYEMTKDGFMFLVMGFTGKKAAQFKEAYINEFNRMEVMVNGRAAKTTRDERTPLRDAVNMLVGKKGLMYPEAYSFIHQRFAVAHIDELSKEQIPSAIEYIHKLVFEGELLPKKQSPVLIENTALTQNIKALTHHCRFVSDIYLKELDPILCQLRSDYADLLIDHFKAIRCLSTMVSNSYTRLISPN